MSYSLVIGVLCGSARGRCRLGMVASAAGFLLIASAGLAWSFQRDDARRTVLDGVYTAEQATRGQAAYDRHCGSCHLEDLSGTDRGPALAGDSFLSAWIDASVGDLFDRTHRSMPQDEPGTLPVDVTRDIVAYLLQANDYPVGGTELQTDLTALHGIVIVRKP